MEFFFLIDDEHCHFCVNYEGKFPSKSVIPKKLGCTNDICIL